MLLARREDHRALCAKFCVPLPKVADVPSPPVASYNKASLKDVDLSADFQKKFSNCYVPETSGSRDDHLAHLNTVMRDVAFETFGSKKDNPKKVVDIATNLAVC